MGFRDRIKRIMNTSKKLGFYLVFVAVLVFLPFPAFADGGRFFVKSTKGFWKNALGARHSFDNGFSSDMSDFQVKFAQMFGVEIEPVATLQILPVTGSAVPTKTPIESVKQIRNKKGVIRYLPSDKTPWGIETIYNDALTSLTVGGADVSVAVLDTGVNMSHPDLARRISQCADFTNPRTPVVDGKCDDKNGHGTHVAGIIAADSGADGLGIYGVAPESKILAYKVCDASGSCYADDIAAAIRMAADKKANIINMSFGTDVDIALIKDAINYATSNNVLLVAAAGNDGPLEGSIDYPAAYASVIAVGAINKDKKVPEWSSRGVNSKTDPKVINDGDVEFAAPGEYIESTWNNNGYIILSGTSMASPFVAGLAAKYWQLLADKPAEVTREILHSMANLLPDYSLDSESAGYGLPQIKK